MRSELLPLVGSADEFVKLMLVGTGVPAFAVLAPLHDVTKRASPKNKLWSSFRRVGRCPSDVFGTTLGSTVHPKLIAKTQELSAAKRFGCGKGVFSIRHAPVVSCENFHVPGGLSKA